MQSFMQAINDLELVLIELEYAAADYSHRQASTSDPLERADLEALLYKIVTAKRVVKYALDSIQIPSEGDMVRAA